MKILTAYGEFEVVDTATGIMATHENGTQYFVDGWVPNSDFGSLSSLESRLIAAVETEYEFQHNIKED
jgi:hypothetical protein